MKIDRRDFMRRVVGTSGAALLGTVAGGGIPQAIGKRGPVQASLPEPGGSGIEHVVVVMMENRSFDHFLGWLPTPSTQNFHYPILNSNKRARTYHLRDYQGCGHPNPDHSYQGGRIEWDDGAMNGWLLDPNNDEFAIGYYNQRDIPFLGALAQSYTTLGNYFCSFLGPTYPNRIFMLAGQTDRLDDSLLPAVTLPTIFDELLGNGVSVRYYYNNLPFVALWGLKYLGVSSLYDQFLNDAASGNLPAVSFVDPRFNVLDLDGSNDDEPHSNIQRGDAFLARTFNAVASGPAWPSTVFIITFDEWGGFFDHIAPPRVVAPNNVDEDSAGGVLLGFRVPTVVASPWTRAESGFFNDGTVFEHTSILKLIEWRWGLNPLTSRDGSSEIGNLADVLDFSTYDAQVPALPSPAAPAPSPCLLQSLAPLAQPQAPSTSPWSQLANSSLLDGWSVKK